MGWNCKQALLEKRIQMWMDGRKTTGSGIPTSGSHAPPPQTRSIVKCPCSALSTSILWADVSHQPSSSSIGITLAPRVKIAAPLIRNNIPWRTVPSCIRPTARDTISGTPDVFSGLSPQVHDSTDYTVFGIISWARFRMPIFRMWNQFQGTSRLTSLSAVAT